MPVASSARDRASGRALAVVQCDRDPDVDVLPAHAHAAMALPVPPGAPVEAQRVTLTTIWILGSPAQRCWHQWQCCTGTYRPRAEPQAARAFLKVTAG